MGNILWPRALVEACLQTYHPGLHSQTEERIVVSFFRQWGTYSSDVWPLWEHVLYQGRDDDGRFTQDIFPILHRALTEGQEEDRLFALFLVGALATSEARELLPSFLTSESRKERWASAISLGRLKDERVFALLQTLLLEGFTADTIFARSEDVQRAQETCHDYRYEMQERKMLSKAFWDIIEHLERIDYEWYLRQRAECALVLGAWDNPVVVPRLKEAFAGGMEHGTRVARLCRSR